MLTFDLTAQPRASVRGSRRFWQDTGAAAAVEFAIIVPVLLTLVFGVIDFGRALWTVNVATSALREGARTAAAQVGQSTCTAAAGAATNRVTTYLTTAGLTQPSTISVSATCDATNSFITVRYVNTVGNTATNDRYPFTTIAPVVSKLVLTTGVRVPAAVFRWEKAS
jgi:Flp pilus assembly protein TadG